MGKKLKLVALALLVAVVAYIYPTARVKYVKHVKPRLETAIRFGKKVANLKILGKPVPWKFILPVFGVLLTLLYVRRRKKKLQRQKEAEEKRKAELAAQYKALGGTLLTPEDENQPQVVEPVLTVTAAMPESSPPSPPAATPVTTPTVTTPTVTTPVTTPDCNAVGSRIASFCEWSSTNTVNVFALARAGFQYTGRGDVVECFKCGGTLKEWEADDEPLKYHNKYYPNCEFVKQRLSETEIEKRSCRKRIDDLLCASNSLVGRLKDVLKMNLSGEAGIETEEIIVAVTQFGGLFLIIISVMLR